MKTKEVKILKQKAVIKCEGCGFVVRGNSEDNARANLKLHLKSNKHKKLVSMKQDISSGAIVDISGAKIIQLKKESDTRESSRS